MTTVDKAMALLLRPVRHAVNNMSMVLMTNLESAVPRLPEGERTTVQVTRARDSARDYDHLTRSYLALGKDAAVKTLMAERVLKELMPLLALASGGPLALEVARGGAAVEARTPLLEAALIVAASGGRALPPGQRPALVLDGPVLRLAWPLPEGAEDALAEAGVAVSREGGEGVLLRLPSPAGMLG